jgi:hypothetical protein
VDSLGLATKAARAMRGAISLSIASHFPTMLSAYISRPVRLLPGRARLATKPESTGSETLTITIGIARLAPYVHIDICELRLAEGKLNMFLAINRVSKFTYVEFHENAGKMERR